MYIVLTDVQKRVELREGTKISIKVKNIAHQYDKYQLDRTSSFTLPLTGSNMQALGLAYMPQVYNEEIRRRYKAMLVLDSVTYEGSLYATRVTNSGVAVTFVFGDMEPLKELFATKLRELDREELNTIFSTKYMEVESEGGMIEYIFMNTPFELPPSTELTGANKIRTIAMARPYVNITGGLYRPTKNLAINLNEVLKMASNEIVNIVPPDEIYAAVAPKLVTLENNVLFETKLNFTSDPDPYVGVDTYTRETIPNIPNINYFQDQTALSYIVRGNSTQSQVKQLIFEPLMFGADVMMTLSSDFPDNTFIVSVAGVTGSTIGPLEWSSIEFWGDYRITLINLYINNYRFEGVPLAGRTIELPQYYTRRYKDTNGNDVSELTDIPNKYFFIRYENLSYNSNSKFAGIDSMPTDVFKFTFSVKNFNGVSKEETNMLWRVGDQLPDMTVGELVRLYSYMSGLYPVYSASSGQLTFNSYNRMAIKDVREKLIRINGIERQVGVFGAQKNTVEYKQSQNSIEKVSKSWNVENENITEQKTLYTIPMLHASRNPNANLALLSNGSPAAYTATSPVRVVNNKTSEEVLWTNMRCQFVAGREYVIQISSNIDWRTDSTPEGAEVYFSKSLSDGHYFGTYETRGQVIDPSVSLKGNSFVIKMLVIPNVTGTYEIRADANAHGTYDYYDFVVYENLQNGVYIDDIRVNEDGVLEPTGDDYTITTIDEAGVLQQANFAGLEAVRTDFQAMADESTKVTAELALSAYEFAQYFTDQNILYIQGVRYFWIEATWADNKANVTLQKINESV